MRTTENLLVAAAFAALASLGFDCNSEKSCVPGLVQSCPCAGGGQSVQTCLEDRSFGPCQCPDAKVPPGPDGSSGLDLKKATDATKPGDQGPGPDLPKTKPDLFLKKDTKPVCTSNTTMVSLSVRGTRQAGATTKSYACLEFTWDGITTLVWEKTYSMAPSPTGADTFRIDADFVHPTGVWPSGKTYYYTIKSSTACNAAAGATYVSFATVSSSYSVPCSSNIFMGPPEINVEWW